MGPAVSISKRDLEGKKEQCRVCSDLRLKLGSQEVAPDILESKKALRIGESEPNEEKNKDLRAKCKGI